MPHQNLIFVGTCLNNSLSSLLFYMARNVIIVSETEVLVLQWFSLMWPDPLPCRVLSFAV